MTDSEAASFKKDIPTWEEMQEAQEKNPYQFGTEKRETTRIGNELAEKAKEGKKDQDIRQRMDEFEGVGTGLSAEQINAANENYKTTGKVTDKKVEPTAYDTPEKQEERKDEVEKLSEANKERFDEGKKILAEGEYNPQAVTDAAKARKDAEGIDYKVGDPEAKRQEAGKKYFSRLSTLRDIGVESLGATANALKQSEKQYGHLINLAGAMATGKPMSIASQALTTTMEGFSTIGDLIEDEKKALQVKTGIDPMKLKGKLAIKRPSEYQDLDNAVAAERMVNSTFNAALQEAAGDRDVTQLTDSELQYVHDRMNAALKDDYERLRQKPKDQWNAEDKAFYQAYIAVENGMGKQARSLSSQHSAEDKAQRSIGRWEKQLEKQKQAYLDAHMGERYRAGQLTDPKDIGKYMRQLEGKQLAGTSLTADEQKDLDDMRMNYGWRREIKSMQVDMTNDARLIPLWTQKAGASLIGAMGSEADVLNMYELARKGDIDGIRAMLDTNEKRSAATGFSKLGIANSQDANLWQNNPMSADDVVLAYAINSAIQGKPFDPPVKPGEGKLPSWIIRKRLADFNREQRRLKDEQRKVRNAQAKQNTVDQGVNTDSNPQRPVDDAIVKQLEQVNAQIAQLTAQLNGEPADLEAEIKKNPARKQNPPIEKEVAEEVAEVGGAPEVAQKGGKQRRTPQSWHTADTDKARDDYYLRNQVANLRGTLATMSPDDPEYIKTSNRYNEAMAENLLHYLNRNGGTPEEKELVMRFRDAAQNGWFKVPMLDEYTGQMTPAKQKKALFNTQKPEKTGDGAPIVTQDPQKRAELERKSAEAAKRIEENAPKIREMIDKSSFRDINPVAVVQNMIDNDDATDEELVALDETLKKEGSEIRKLLGPLAEDYDRADSNATNANLRTKYKDVFDHLDRIEAALEMIHPSDLDDEEIEPETEENPVETEEKETQHRKSSIYSTGRAKITDVKRNKGSSRPTFVRDANGKLVRAEETPAETVTASLEPVASGPETVQEPVKTVEEVSEPVEEEKKPQKPRKQITGTKNKPNLEQITANNTVDYLGRKDMEKNISDLQAELDGITDPGERNKYILDNIAANQKVIDDIVSSTGMTEEQLCKNAKKKGMDKAELDQMIAFFNARVSREFLNNQRNAKIAPEQPKQNTVSKVEHKKTTKAPVKALNNTWSARPRGYKDMSDDEYRAFATDFISETVVPKIASGIPAEMQLLTYLEQRDNLEKRIQEQRNEGIILGDEELERLKALELRAQVLGAWLDYRQKNNPTGKKKIYGVPRSQKKLARTLNPKDKS